ncbi:MAG TPA: chloroperoxidase [Casimicrobiaceae bacterium]|nr:chloroperoxidase [Casimicrobiaceae bacterium]
MHPSTGRNYRLGARLASIGALALVIVVCVPTAPGAQAQGFRNGVEDALGPQYHENPYAQRAKSRPSKHDRTPRGMVRHWNEVAIDASGLDHTPVATGEVRVFGEQLGPARSSRAMAIVHIAIFDAVNAISGRYRSYTGMPAASRSTSMEAAIAQAAHDTLSALFPSQKATFDEQLARDLDAIHGRPEDLGVELGQRAAAAILSLRANDGSARAEPRVDIEFLTSDDPGKWRQDPVSQIPIALGAYWHEVKPFVMASSAQFRAPAPPALESPEYAQAFAEVKALGGDGIVTPTQRTTEQTVTGIFWAYDGTPSLCAPPRLYNQITMQIADQMDTDVVELTRLLALVNTAMADAGIAVWESKYYYEFWRPVTGIREADENPALLLPGDGNPATVADLTFMPLGAPASNLTGPNFTPPFPAYPSGHAGFGGALFQVLRRFYERDHIAFTFVSDEFNGVTLDREGNVRPLIPRQFSSLSEAEEENGQSRIYLGIHWSFDKREGIAQGRRVADHVFDHAFLPVR